MEELKYTIEDDKIAELFGVQNFTTKESAVLELVKNAYDSGATLLKIKFTENSLYIIDNGCGMDYSTLKNQWTKVGHSDKGYTFIDNDNYERVYSGSKGIGRFALARLGSNIEVITRKEGSNAVRWKTDWVKTTIEDFEKSDFGTEIIIRKLRDKWNEKIVKKLSEYISSAYNDDLMRIEVYYKELLFVVQKKFENPALGDNCVSIINLRYESNTGNLNCMIESDEFLESAYEFVQNIDIKKYETNINLYNEKFNELDIDENELRKYLTEVGSFNAELYFFYNTNSLDKEKFLYKHEKLNNKYKGGVSLFRNAFSISSYEGTKDWIGFGPRYRKSPAAATHPTGSWRVRENQIAGKVLIDKQENSYLQDLANRQGLDENEHYKMFIQIITKGISEFERYRQSIIRMINKKNKDEACEIPLIEKFLEKPEEIRDYEKKQIDLFASEILGLKQENDAKQEEIRSIEERYKYDIRILNVLSTMGLKSSAIAHELHNDRDYIAIFHRNIIKTLKNLGLWEILNSSENTKHPSSNVPQILERSNKINQKMLRFMDVILENIEKRQFKFDTYDIQEIVNLNIKNWEKDYDWIKINYDASGLLFKTSRDIINVILDNLILNSVQQNSKLNYLEIDIETFLVNDYLHILYKDHGVGLNEKYIKDPYKILEVHETSRNNGHGLGMWIINNTVNFTGGSILNIKGDDGFTIELTIGVKD